MSQTGATTGEPVAAPSSWLYSRLPLSRTRAISNIALSRTKLSVPLAPIQAEQLLVISPAISNFLPGPLRVRDSESTVVSLVKMKASFCDDDYKFLKFSFS